MGRSQRHKVYIQGYASDDRIRAEGMIAGNGSSVRKPPASLAAQTFLALLEQGVKREMTSLEPNVVPALIEQTITITGENFRAGDKVQAGSDLVPASFISDTQLSFSLRDNHGPKLLNVWVVVQPDYETDGPFAAGPLSITIE